VLCFVGVDTCGVFEVLFGIWPRALAIGGHERNDFLLYCFAWLSIVQEAGVFDGA
jgi:hypothetical protein